MSASQDPVSLFPLLTCFRLTCTILFHSHDFVDGDTTERAAACETGKYVQGIEYLMVQPGRRLFSTLDDDLDDITDGTIDDSFPSPTPSPTSGSRGLPSPSWTTDDDSRSVYYYVDDDFDDDYVQQPASSPAGSEDDAETPTGDVGDGSSTYFITSIAVVCSAAALGKGLVSFSLNWFFPFRVRHWVLSCPLLHGAIVHEPVVIFLSPRPIWPPIAAAAVFPDAVCSASIYSRQGFGFV